MAIDWTLPVYRVDTGSQLILKSVNGVGERAFRGFEDPKELSRGHMYYNEDGSPFHGGPAITQIHPGP
jgi:hypothetical protein